MIATSQTGSDSFADPHAERRRGSGFLYAGEILADTLLPLGLLLSPATQLRAEGSVIGPGELCLAAWIGVQLVRETSRLGPPMTPALTRLLAFWTLFAFAQCLGLLMGLAFEPIRDPSSALHDTIAYTLMAAVSCLSVALPDAGRRLRRMVWMTVGLGTVLLAIQLAEAWGLARVTGANPYDWNRLRGWSENPNALALVSSALVALPLFLAETATRASERTFASLLCIPPMYVGLLTGSDSFSLFLLTALPLVAVLRLRLWLLSRDGELTLRSASAGLILIAAPLGLAGAAPFAPSGIALIEQRAAETYAENGQGEDRLNLWKEALRRGIQSGMVGYGPGAHITDSKIKREPPPNFEAHNTLLDLFTQGGLLIVLLFVWLTMTSFIAACRAHRFSLAALLAGLIIFSMFHQITRHPIFWFGITLCLVAARTTASEPLLRRASP